MSFRRLNTNESLPPPGVKISVHNHQTLTSSGVSSLDELLGGGIPLGRIFLLKQDRFSGYSDVLFKYFIAQGIYLGHEIILASLDQNPAQLLKELMKATEKQSDDKEKDEEYIPAVQRSARTMGNLRTVVDRTEKMSIAWRYENQPKFNSGLQSNTSKAYLHTFDLTKRIEPEVLGLAKITIYGAKELTQDKYNVLLEHIRKKLSLPQFNQGVKCTKNVLRVCVNGVGSPDWNEDEKLVELFKFLYSLKGMIRNTNGVVYVTIPAYLYNDFHGLSSNPYIRRIEHAVDGVIEIESFQGSVNPMNPAYTSDYHGLVHPLSLFQVDSLIQTTRMPTVKLHSLGFKVRRKRFQIETFTLPPEDEDETAEQQAGNCSTGKSKLDF